MKRISYTGKERIEWSRLKGKAIQAVHYAIKKGLLKNLKKEIIPCIDCGARALVYDHRDYNKPLSVSPVCISCNITRGTNAPILKDNKKRCPECDSSNILYRLKTKFFWCRICGYEWPKSKVQIGGNKYEERTGAGTNRVRKEATR